MTAPDGAVLALVEATLQTGAEVSLAVGGNSMLPFIRPGDTVRLRQPKGCEPRLGDVVAVRGMPDCGLLVHRVVRRRGGLLLLRGDNTTASNGDYARSEVLGVVASVERNGRRVPFGTGRWGTLVALTVRVGLTNAWVRTRLKFVRGASRLPLHKGDDGNE